MDADLWVEGSAVVDLRVGLFLDGGDNDGKAVGACGVEQKEREAAVAGDEAQGCGFGLESSVGREHRD